MKSRFTYANVTASIALFVALGGVSYAATALPANSVGSTQLKSSAVTNSKIADATITSQKLNADTIKALKGQTGDRGLTGPTGSQGVKGDTGATGPVGPKGDTGSVGPQGVKGDAGSSPNYFVIAVSNGVLTQGEAYVLEMSTYWNGADSNHDYRDLKFKTDISNCVVAAEVPHPFGERTNVLDAVARTQVAEIDRLDDYTARISILQLSPNYSPIYGRPTFRLGVICPS